MKRLSKQLANLKKSIPFILFVLAIFVATFLWDLIKIPLNPENIPVGDSYLLNNHHSQNDTLRFIVFLILPFFSVIFYHQYYEKKFFKNLKELLLNNDKTRLNKNTNFLLIFWLTVLIIIFEFFLLNFNEMYYHVDVFHEGLWLTPSSNSKLTEEFWQSTYIARGFFGNFYPYLIWNFLDIETIGIVRFFDLIFILLNKILLLFISFKIATISNLNKNQKILFYLLLSLSLLFFTSYMSPVFFLRSFLLLLFVLLILNYLISKKKIINLFFIGFLSSLSMFWYIDIGIYINLFLLLVFFYLLIRREINYFLILFISITFGWLVIYLYLPKNEWSQFLNNVSSIILTVDYIHGLIFPTPFLSQDTRSTKALVFFLITGYLIIKSINLSVKQDSKFILVILLIFIIGIIQFKYGLSRSDDGHIRIATGFIYLSLFSISFYKIINAAFARKNISNYLNINKLNFFLLILLLCSIFINKKFEDKSLANLPHFYSGVKNLINYKDDKFINKDYQSFVSFYKRLTNQDKCLMIFTNEPILYYLLKKPTCSKYYLLYLSTPINIQHKIVKDLSSKKPNFLVYKSEVDNYGHVGDRLKVLDSYIRTEYSFFEKFKHWEIYKKN